MTARDNLLWGGITSGIFAGIALKTGISMEPDSLRLQIIESFCKLPQDAVQLDCSGLVQTLSLLILIISLSTIISQASKLRKSMIFGGNFPPIIEGILIHIAGFGIGAIAILIMLSI